MAKKLVEVEFPLSWEVMEGEKPGGIMLRLRHKPFAAAIAEGMSGGTTVVLAFSQDDARELAHALLGGGASVQRPERLDS